MFSNVDAEKMAQDLFGCQGKATRLPGESDCNFHIKTNDNNEFLLKISNDNEKKSIVDMQNEVLNRLQTAKLPFQSPVPQRTLTNEWVGHFSMPKGNLIFVRLFSFVPGTLFAKARPYTPELLASLGYQLAHLNNVLHNVRHPEAKRYLKWDLKQASWIREHLHVIENQHDKKCIEYHLIKFESEISPILSNLRHSIIHGDINDYNVLVSNVGHETEYISGFIDFGDMVETSTICELAIAITYAIMDHPEPLAAVTHIIKAYHAISPLEDKEIDILFDLIGIRLSTSVVNSAIRKRENPNDPYLVISERPAWKLLKTLQTIDSQFARNTFHKTCRFNYVTH